MDETWPVYFETPNMIIFVGADKALFRREYLLTKIKLTRFIIDFS